MRDKFLKFAPSEGRITSGKLGPMYKESTGARVWSGQAVAHRTQRVVAVFACNSQASLRAIRHVRAGGDAPVWLYSTMNPARDIADLCERVVVCKSPLRLLLTAQRQLWPLRSALAVGAWTGERGNWLLKLCPFLVPPFRALFLNAGGDFLPGTPGRVAEHWRHRLRETAHKTRVRASEIANDYVLCSEPVTRAKDWARAASLFLLATLLRWCAYPHRRFFERVHGDNALHIPLTGANEPHGIVWFEHHRNHWNGPALAKLTHGNSARWLVWHDASEPGEIDDLLPLFDRPDTFAVSRQSSYRGWKPMLIPTAPFRALQPGERTRVIAPLGSTIVVDLNKLAALGIPDVSYPITAWMLLFWKAAAAGWRCYSAGQSAVESARACPQSDFPTEETAFFLRVALDRGYRALGPRQPLLGRGNIAFSADHHRSARLHGTRLKVLVVSPFLPYPLSHGGAVRIYSLCRALSPRVDFALIAVRENREAVDYGKLHEVFREVYVIDIDQTVGAPNAIPEQARLHECGSLRALIADVCLNWKPDLVQFEYTHTAGLKSSAGSIPAILVEHDITFSLYRQLADAEPSRKSHNEYQRWLAFESRWLAEYEAVWTVSESDRAIAVEAGRRPAERTFTVPNGVDIQRFVSCEAPAALPEILYVGSFRHLPNIIAFEKLRTSIMPLVWTRLPRAVLRVVAGPRHDYFWRKFGRRSDSEACDPRVPIHDFVEDLRPLYAKASVVVAPLQVSAGTNIKIMEAMACGKAIVSAPPGCSGLGLVDGSDLLIRSGSADFADAVCGLLADTAQRCKIGAHARRTVEERFSWTALAEEAYRSYEGLVVPRG